MNENLQMSTEHINGNIFSESGSVVSMDLSQLDMDSIHILYLLTLSKTISCSKS